MIGCGGFGNLKDPTGSAVVGAGITVGIIGVGSSVNGGSNCTIGGVCVSSTSLTSTSGGEPPGKCNVSTTCGRGPRAHGEVQNSRRGGALSPIARFDTSGLDL